MTPLSMTSLVIFLQSLSCPADVQRFLVMTNLTPSYRTLSFQLFFDFPTCLLPPRLPTRFFFGGGGFCCRTFLLHVQPSVTRSVSVQSVESFYCTMPFTSSGPNLPRRIFLSNKPTISDALWRNFPLLHTCNEQLVGCVVNSNPAVTAIC
jgi:hypothetical protein